MIMKWKGGLYEVEILMMRGKKHAASIIFSKEQMRLL